MSDQNEVQIPEIGDSGEFFITYEMVLNAKDPMRELGLQLLSRSMSIPGGLVLTVIEKLDGYLIKWEPHPDPNTTIEDDPIAVYLVERRKEV